MGTLTLVALFLYFALTHGLIGYDCGGGNLNITSISLLNTEDCDLGIQETTQAEKYMQLLQLSDYDFTSYIQCKIKISRTIYYCGMHSHTSVVHNGHHEYIMDLSEQRCQELHTEGSIRIGVGSIIQGLRANSTSRHPIILGGTIEQNGRCQGIQYADPYGTWNNVVIQGFVSITLKQGYAPVKLTEGKIILPSGTRCALADGHCMDDEYGHTFWQLIPISTCNFAAYDVLYEGIATKIHGNGDSPTVYTLTSKDVTFALATTTEYHLCGYTLLKTEHPKLFVLETSKDRTFTVRNLIPLDNLDIFTYVNSKFIYVERNIKTQITSLYNSVLTQKCELENQVLRNALTLATILPDEFAYSVMKGPGHMAVAAGEVVHIIKCIPVDVTLRQELNCHSELPVTHKNQSYFLTPKSRILTKLGSTKECNLLVPTMYRIENSWIELTPKPRETKPPQTLRPSIKPSWEYRTPDYLATSGIYSEDDIERLRDHIMFPAEKPALLNDLARGLAGYPQGPNTAPMYNLLDENTLKKIANNTASHLWAGFVTFGSTTAGIMGIYILLRLLKLVVDTIIHGYTLHTAYGCSIHLLAALWSSITHLLLHLANYPKEEDQPTKSSAEDSDDSSSPPNQSVSIQTAPPIINISGLRDRMDRLEQI